MIQLSMSRKTLLLGYAIGKRRWRLTQAQCNSKNILFLIF